MRSYILWSKGEQNIYYIKNVRIIILFHQPLSYYRSYGRYYKRDTSGMCQVERTKIVVDLGVPDENAVKCMIVDYSHIGDPYWFSIGNPLAPSYARSNRY